MMTEMETQRICRKLEVLEGIVHKMLDMRNQPRDVLERKLVQMEDLIAELPDNNDDRHCGHFHKWVRKVVLLWEDFCINSRPNSKPVRGTSLPSIPLPTPKGNLQTTFKPQKTMECQKTIDLLPKKAHKTCQVLPTLSDPAIEALRAKLEYSFSILPIVKTPVDYVPIEALLRALLEAQKLSKQYWYVLEPYVFWYAVRKLSTSWYKLTTNQNVKVKTIRKLLERKIQLARLPYYPNHPAERLFQPVGKNSKPSGEIINKNTNTTIDREQSQKQQQQLNIVPVVEIKQEPSDTMLETVYPVVGNGNVNGNQSSASASAGDVEAFRVDLLLQNCRKFLHENNSVNPTF